MINSFMEGLRQLFRALQAWVTIAPWEQGLRVRLGRRVKLLRAGVHLKLPIIDVLYIQTVRTRISSLGRQIATTQDGKALTLAGAVGYAIEDIERLYRSLHHAEDTIQSLARARIARFIAMHNAAQCRSHDIEALITADLAQELADYGLADVRVYITEFAIVRTYRLIGDYGGGNVFGGALSTDRPTSTGMVPPG